MYGSDEPHPYTERSSTRLSTSGHASYKRAIVYSLQAWYWMCSLWQGHWYFVPYKIRQTPDFKQLKVIKILVQNGSGSRIGRDQAVNHF